MTKTIPLLMILAFISGCQPRVENIGRGGLVKNPGGIECGLMFSDGKFLLEIINQGDVIKTINTSTCAYEVAVTSDGKHIPPSFAIMCRRPTYPVVNEFETLLPKKTYLFPMSMTLDKGTLYLGDGGYHLERGRNYTIALNIKPFFLSMNETNTKEITGRLGLINYVTDKLDCGHATIGMR
jgi:hypothetical protein